MDLSRIIPEFNAESFGYTVVSPDKFAGRYEKKNVTTDWTVANEDLTQKTRKESYSKVTDGLGERQKQVYTYLENYDKGATAKELSVAMFDEGLVSSPERNSVHPRLNELVEMGLIKIIGKKTCQYTDRSVAIYSNNK